MQDQLFCSICTQRVNLDTGHQLSEYVYGIRQIGQLSLNCETAALILLGITLSDRNGLLLNRYDILWWCHDMKTLSAIQVLCEESPPMTVDGWTLLTKGQYYPVMQSFCVFFVVILNKLINKWSSCLRFEKPYDAHVTSSFIAMGWWKIWKYQFKILTMCTVILIHILLWKTTHHWIFLCWFATCLNRPIP